jgi:hypothetical protein
MRLRAADKYFTLYQAHSLPFLHEGIKKFIQIDKPFTYLAVAEDRQFFTILTEDMLAKCTTDFIQCPSNMVLRKSHEENCSIALFTGKAKMALRKNRRVFLEDLEPECRPLGGSP